MAFLSCTSSADSLKDGFSSFSSDQLALSSVDKDGLFASLDPPSSGFEQRDADIGRILCPAPIKFGDMSRPQSLLMTGAMRSEQRVVVLGGLPELLSDSSCCSSVSSTQSSCHSSLHGNPFAKKESVSRSPAVVPRTATGFVRRFVSHEYTDRSTTMASNSPAVNTQSTAPSGRRKHQRKKRQRGPPGSFPKALHVMLTASDDEAEDIAHIISWQPHGRAFRVHDQPAFTAQVMPRFLPKQTRWESFIRMLNLYGLKRLTRKGPDQGCYYHECFLRGKPELLDHASLQRRRVKGSKIRSAYSPQAEPNFYDMPPLENKKADPPGVLMDSSAAVVSPCSPGGPTGASPIVQKPSDALEPFCLLESLSMEADCEHCMAPSPSLVEVLVDASTTTPRPISADVAQPATNNIMSFDEQAALVAFLSDFEPSESNDLEGFAGGCSNGIAI